MIVLALLAGCAGDATPDPERVARLWWTGHLLALRDDPVALDALTPVDDRAQAAFSPLAAAHDAAAGELTAALRDAAPLPPAAVDALVAADADLRALAVSATLDGLAVLGPATRADLAPGVLARAVTLGPVRAVVEGHGQAPLPDLSRLAGPLPPDAPAVAAADLARLARVEPATLGFAHALAALDPTSPDLPARLRAAVAAVEPVAAADLRERLSLCARLLAGLAPDARAALVDDLPLQVYCDVAPSRVAFPFAYGEPAAPVLPAGPPPTDPPPSASAGPHPG